MSELLRANVADEVKARIGVPVRVAVETRDPLTRKQAASVLCRVELLLRDGRHQQAQSFRGYRIQDPVEQLIQVAQRHDLGLRYVAEIRPRDEKDGRGKLGEPMIAACRSLPARRQLR